jgi:hypothetical protein
MNDKIVEKMRLWTYFRMAKSFSWPFKCNNGFRFTVKDYRDYGCSLECYLHAHDLAMEFTTRNDSEGSMCFILSIPFLFSIYLSFDFPYPKWMFKLFMFDEKDYYKQSRIFGFRFDIREGYCTLSGGRYSDMGSSDDPWYYLINISIPNLLLGRIKYSEKVIESGRCEIPMPEKTYKAKYEITEYTHSRSRWFTKRFKRVDITPDEGIPHPGKGTCSYNCGDTALESMSIPTDSVPHAISKIVLEVHRLRDTYPL